MSKRKQTAKAAGSSPPKRKRKRKAAKRKARAPKRRKSSKRRKRSSSTRRRSSSRGRGFKFECTRVKVDRRGYDSSGKFWGKNSREIGKLYRVRVIDRASDTYRDNFVHAHTQTEAKAKVSRAMVTGVDAGAFHSSPRSKSSLAEQVFGGRQHHAPHKRAFEHYDEMAPTTRGRALQRERHAISNGAFYAMTDDELNEIFNDRARASVSSRDKRIAGLHLRARAMHQRGDTRAAAEYEREADQV